MNHDDFAKRVTSKLDQLANQHRNKAAVMDNVLDQIQQKKPAHRFNSWKMTGFALAAAITGFVIIPNLDGFEDQPQQQVVVGPKLSPQMMEDLDMLSVLGEDTSPHGS